LSYFQADRLLKDRTYEPANDTAVMNCAPAFSSKTSHNKIKFLDTRMPQTGYAATFHSCVIAMPQQCLANVLIARPGFRVMLQFGQRGAADWACW